MWVRKTGWLYLWWLAMPGLNGDKIDTKKGEKIYLKGLSWNEEFEIKITYYLCVLVESMSEILL
jgi:hypothetical protein